MARLELPSRLRGGFGYFEQLLTVLRRVGFRAGLARRSPEPRQSVAKQPRDPIDRHLPTYGVTQQDAAAEANQIALLTRSRSANAPLVVLHLVAQMVFEAIEPLVDAGFRPLGPGLGLFLGLAELGRPRVGPGRRRVETGRPPVRIGYRRSTMDGSNNNARSKAVRAGHQTSDDELAGCGVEEPKNRSTRYL